MKPWCIVIGTGIFFNSLIFDFLSFRTIVDDVSISSRKKGIIGIGRREFL